MNDETKMKLAIERLKIEKDEIEETYFESGKDDGLDWCLDAHYEGIQRVLHWDGESIPDDNILSIFEDSIHEDELMGYNEDPSSMNPFNIFAQYYFDGFVKGVEEFWNHIKDKLE